MLEKIRNALTLRRSGTATEPNLERYQKSLDECGAFADDLRKFEKQIKGYCDATDGFLASCGQFTTEAPTPLEYDRLAEGGGLLPLEPTLVPRYAALYHRGYQAQLAELLPRLVKDKFEVELLLPVRVWLDRYDRTKARLPALTKLHSRLESEHKRASKSLGSRDLPTSPSAGRKPESGPLAAILEKLPTPQTSPARTEGTAAALPIEPRIEETEAQQHARAPAGLSGLEARVEHMVVSSFGGGRDQGVITPSAEQEADVESRQPLHGLSELLDEYVSEDASLAAEVGWLVRQAMNLRAWTAESLTWLQDTLHERQAPTDLLEPFPLRASASDSTSKAAGGFTSEGLDTKTSSDASKQQHHSGPPPEAAYATLAEAAAGGAHLPATFEKHLGREETDGLGRPHRVGHDQLRLEAHREAHGLKDYQQQAAAKESLVADDVREPLGMMADGTDSWSNGHLAHELGLNKPSAVLPGAALLHLPSHDASNLHSEQFHPIARSEVQELSSL